VSPSTIQHVIVPALIRMLSESEHAPLSSCSFNAHVDAKFALNAPARYVNDNFDASKINARFDKNKQRRRATLVATRLIKAGEEVYASYGESYWEARGINPKTGEKLQS
jgi:GH25 family lysozyme M1 (1,4-beta-N-acetylmuramidase)